MHIHHRHEWNITPEQAIALQKEMAHEVIFDRPLDLSTVKLVAGVDVSVKNDGTRDMSQAAIVIVTYPDLQPVETVLATLPTPFPYIPGLLTFREGPVLEMAFAKLQNEPDVLIFDGMGRAHPRRMGIATHMGLWLQKPTIGCGKTLFVGKYIEPPNERGAYTPLVHRGETIGVTLRTRIGVKPVFISPGHLIDLQSSIDLVMSCTPKYRLPEPIRMAHNAAGQF
jgi:deoxyribonuclease V